MAGEDQTPKPDLRADPPEAPRPEAPQQDAPLPAFIYGRNGASGAGGSRSDRRNFNERIGDMDRKTLLGLAAGAGMLGLVLFFAGMLVGAGLFMDSDEAAVTTPMPKGTVEMLATAPDEREMSDAAEPRVSEVVRSEPVANAKPAPESDDPLGDLIAERSAALAESSTSDTANGAARDAVAKAETETETETETEAEAETETAVRPMAAPEAPSLEAEETADAPTIKAPEIRDTANADDAKAAVPAAPDLDAPSDGASDSIAETADAPAAPAVAGDEVERPFSVQVGAFKVHENASQRAEELRKTGLDVAVVMRGPEGDGAWYYVRVGKYAEMAQARDMAAKVKKDQGLEGFPVRAEPNDREVE